VSTTGDASWVLVNLNMSADSAIDAVGSLQNEIVTPPGLKRATDRQCAAERGHVRQSERDLSKAETISLP